MKKLHDLQAESVNKIAVIAILSFLFGANIAFADYVAVQDYQNELGSSNPAYAIGYDATTTHRISELILHPSQIGTSTSIYVKVFFGASPNANDGVQFGTSSTASLVVGTTSIYFTPSITVPEGVSVSLIWETQDNSTMRFRTNDHIIAPNIHYWANNSTKYTSGVFGVKFKILGYGLPPIQDQYDENGVVVVCNTFDVGCYVSKAGAYLFYPSDSAMGQFVTLKDEIKTKAPFGYFTSSWDLIAGFSTTSAPQFVLATSSPITTYIFNPIRSGLQWILYFAGLYWLYKRLTDIKI